MEQEIASIVRFILNVLGDKVKPCYHKVPKDFEKNQIYFPAPEFSTRLSSSSCYKIEYMWLIKIFAVTNEKAYQYASEIAQNICKNRFSIPLINKDGTNTGKSFYIFAPEITKADYGVYTLHINWDSIRLYTGKEVAKMRKHFEIWTNKKEV